VNPWLEKISRFIRKGPHRRRKTPKISSEAAMDAPKHRDGARMSNVPDPATFERGENMVNGASQRSIGRHGIA